MATQISLLSYRSIRVHISFRCEDLSLGDDRSKVETDDKRSRPLGSVLDADSGPIDVLFKSVNEYEGRNHIFETPPH